MGQFDVLLIIDEVTILAQLVPYAKAISHRLYVHGVVYTLRHAFLPRRQLLLDFICAMHIIVHIKFDTFGRALSLCVRGYIFIFVGVINIQ